MYYIRYECEINMFTFKILEWYNLHKRMLPWRNMQDPYKIWISEVILQQTRVNQGLPYYERFIEKFATLEQLALATQDEVLGMWQGLGYYSRARNMHSTAQWLYSQNKEFPKDYQTLIQLKGIGEYTASAIASFAGHERRPVLDGNVARVLARYKGVLGEINQSKVWKELQAWAWEYLPKDHHWEYNQAIMEFGALQCIPVNPVCEVCPLWEDCAAVRMNKVQELPEKAKAKPKKELAMSYYLLELSPKKVVLLKRNESDIWQGLYEFVPKEILEAWMGGEMKLEIHYESKPYKHVLSHRMIHAKYYVVSKLTQKLLDKLKSINYVAVDKEVEHLYAKPVLVQKMLEDYFNLKTL